VDLRVFGLRAHSLRAATVNVVSLHRRFNGPVIVGHRGAGRGSVTSGLLTVRENTLESFLLAYQCGVQWIETDAVRTADDQLTLHHDTVIANGTPIRRLTLAETEELGLTSLSKAFEHLPPDLGMIVEVKHVLSDLYDARSTADLVAEALIAERVRSGRQIASYGFEGSTSQRLGLDRLQSAGVSLGTIAEGGSDLAGMIMTANMFGLPIVAAHTSTLLGERAERQMRPSALKELIASAHEKGHVVLAWCPSAEESQHLSAAGIDALCVDNVPEFMSTWV
jgi:glycerophosphoryl diester phosphodiesterase